MLHAVTLATPAGRTPLAWLLAGPRAGDNNQVLALGELLGWPCEVKQLACAQRGLLPRALSARSTNLRLAGIDLGRSAPLAPPWPRLVISAGRELEPAARWIKARSRGFSRLVHMGRPWSPLEAFDLIISTPQYALPERDNVLLNLLPLHRVTPERLAVEGERWRERLSALAPPRTAVLLGGNSGSFTLTVAKARRLGELVQQQAHAEGNSLLVTDSARTPLAAMEAFLERIRVPMLVYRWRSGEDNPYFGFLAHAERIVITGESVSMLAEASATGKPMQIFDLDDTPPVQASPLCRFAAQFRYHALRDRLARLIGPPYMQRDIGVIQRLLVDSGRARWLQQGPSSAPECIGPDLAAGDRARTLDRVQELLTEMPGC